jgi:drug/metabolite transporter (DMT)-like permease
MSVSTTSGRWRLGLSLALLTCLFWATLPAALKISLEVLEPLTLTWFRFFCALVFTSILLATRGQLRPFNGLGMHRWRLLLLAAVGLIGNYVLFLLGLKYTTPANAQLLIQSAPLMLAIGSIVLFKESVSAGQIAGFSAIAVGLCAFAFEQQTQSVAAASYGFGAMLIFFAAISWAVYALIQKQLLGRLSSQQIMLVMYFVATLALLPFAHFSQFSQIDSVHWWAIGYCAINTIGAYGAFAEAFVHWDASRVSAVLAVTPIFTVTAIHFLAPLIPSHLAPERIGTLGWIGASLVVAGSICAALLKRKVRVAA